MALRDVIGQDRAVNIIRGALGRGRIPTAYLFAGESGTGKKLTALNLAKTLNCQNQVPKSGSAEVHKNENNSSPFGLRDYGTMGLDIDCCDECSSCRKIDSQTHPDFLMITPEKGEIRVDEIRAIEEALAFAPYEGRLKVIIVDDAETMNPSASNAFLKTLEEPPPQSLIILVSASPDSLPETIRSRCSRINFSPLSPAECEKVIKKAGSQQPVVSSQDKEGLSTLARLSMGRPGLAIAGDLTEERDWFMKLFSDMVGGGSKEVWADREGIERWFDLAFVFLRDAAVLKITGNPGEMINKDIGSAISNLSKTLALKDIIECYYRLSFVKGYLGFNLNKSITWNYTGFALKKFGKGM